MPLRHGHAISIDMAYSATLAHVLGKLSSAEHRRLLNLFSRAGLSMDHPQFDEAILDKGTTAILKTRDGKLRAAIPSPIGQCEFLNDISYEDMCAALKVHKELMKEYPREGAGLEAFVDASDTGYTLNGCCEEVESREFMDGVEKTVINDDTISEEGSSTAASSSPGEYALSNGKNLGPKSATQVASSSEVAEKLKGVVGVEAVSTNTA